MPLTRLDNLITSKTGKYLYVSPDDFNASDELNNRGNSPVRPFKSIQRAFLEVARYSYLPGVDNDRFDQFTIMLMPGEHFIDNRPGVVDTSVIDVFGFDDTNNEWTDNSILDLSNPDNIFYKFNNTEGGAIIPRGTSLVGYDLRRTMVKPLYVPDPADSREKRSAIFNVTGGCYFWQFTIKDGETTSLSPLYNPNAAVPSGEVYYSKDDFTKKTAPNYSHHKLTVFEYADKEELQLLYRKIAKAFSAFQPTIDDPGEFDVRVQENRIVGPLSDSRAIESLQFDDATSDPSIPGSNVRVTVTTKIDHGYFAGQSVAVLNTEIDDKLEGTFNIASIDPTDGRKFTYFVFGEVVSTIGPGSNAGASGIQPGDVLDITSSPALGQNALTLAEVDSVESASPYVFNCSIRSTWGICGIWANGLKATGFKSMVIAQYTGVSLQKDDRAFIRYDEFSNTFNQASLKDAFDSIPYHTKGDSFWKDEWRNFHVRASEDAFIQNVSIFAVGFADHFLMESGGDMSITNSNSNFGNTSLHAIGHKGFAFNSDKGGYIDSIIPPQQIETTDKKINYYPFNIPATLTGVEGIQTESFGNLVYNDTRLYLDSNDDALLPSKRPAVSIDGYRLGARQNEKIFVKLEKAYDGDDQEYSAEIEPAGFIKYIAKPDILAPSGGTIDNLALDSANLIEANRTFFQEEVFGYVLEKYPYLQNISYVNPGLDPDSNRYFDARNLILSNRDEIINTAYDSMYTAFGPAGENNAQFLAGNDETKCKRDIGHIVDAIAEDLRDGGNSNIINATKFYFNADGSPLANGLVGEERFAIFAFKRARDLCKLAIANLLTVTDATVTIDASNAVDPAGRYKDSRNLILANKSDIIDAAIAAINAYNPTFVYPGGSDTKCRRDLGLIVDAVAQDLWFGGNEYSIAAIQEYFDNNALTAGGVDGEVSETIIALYKLQDQMNLAVNNQLASTDLTVTLDQTGDPAIVSDTHANAFETITENKKFIAKEAYERMKDVYSNTQYSWNPQGTLGWTPRPGTTEQDCLDDVYNVVDEILYNLKFGGNHKAYDAAEVYVTNQFNGEAITSFLDEERDEAARVFTEAKSVALDVMRNITVIPTNWTPTGDSVQTKDFTQIIDPNNPTCSSVEAALDTLFGIVLQGIGTDAGVGNLGSITRTVPAQPTTYVEGNCSDVLGGIDNLVGLMIDALYAGNLDGVPAVDNGNWDCANVRGTIHTLTDIIVDAIDAGSLTGLPDVSSGAFIANAQISKCYRDVGIITDAVINDLRFGGNLNTIQAGEAYFIGNNLEYIDGEKNETLDAWDAIRHLAISALRNHTTQVNGCALTNGSAIVDVGSNTGLTIGMRVQQYDPNDFTSDAQLIAGSTPITTNIPENTFIKKKIGSTQIELGVENARLDSGATVPVQGPGGSNITLYFTLEKGQWADTLPTTDLTISTSNAGYPECDSVASAVDTLIDNITTIINNGIGSVDLVEATATSFDYATRATVFTIDIDGTGGANPHKFETGTAVRLVPRPRWDSEAQKYVEVDKRLVRLPNGFETNRTYYVIAPGRKTAPYDYSGAALFNGSDQTKLMLAETRANAAAGIYLYSSESDTIDENVEIDMYKFVLDEKYDLDTYKCQLDVAVAGGTAVTGGIVANVAHIFDVPNASTTPQRVFFRQINDSTPLPLLAANLQGDNASANSSDSTAGVADDNGRLNPEFEFYTRYVVSLDKPNKVFCIYKTHADAINDTNRITFQQLSDAQFVAYANKAQTPFAFDPRGQEYSNSETGRWYIKVKDTSSTSDQSIYRESILWRIGRNSDVRTSPDPKTNDSFYKRQEDDRDKDDRTYKIRYVIPNYLEGVRDPINGFVLKTRTDSTRRLRPQRILLKPAPGNFKSDAFFQNDRNPGERIGWTSNEIIQNLGTINNAYDPYRRDTTGAGVDYRKRITTDNNVTMTVQSGRLRDVDGDRYLELNVYDYEPNPEIPALNGSSFRTVKITAPQGGFFEVNKAIGSGVPSDPHYIQWSGFSSGSAYVHAYTQVGSDHYLIIKGDVIDGNLIYSPYTNTRFQQGGIYADLLDDPDMGKSLPLKRLIEKGEDDLFYKQNGAPVYTVTPGDIIKEDGSENRYVVASVEDSGEIDDTFYIFDIETLQRRIPNQQDGIYYLTAIRGNISPLPLGAGNQNNFRNFKFSQPISYLYPQNYKNDPYWFTHAGTTNSEKAFAQGLIDPPATYSAADNYVHGLVRTNDSKSSMTKETIVDLIDTPAFNRNTYTGDNAIVAQEGNASAGAEDRQISLAGDSEVFVDQKWYVELRRPSIARAGNHTFEYLGFGPGNYSTGLPARQEIVLTATQDYYAQAKRQDGGIVFYTGINSNGELYIGNRKINAITGEEEFLERAALIDSDDDEDDISSLVTTFEVPVTFNQNITVNGGEGELVSNFNSPITINVNNSDLTLQDSPLIILSNVDTENPDGSKNDPTLDRTTFVPRQSGDIFIGKNEVKAAIFHLNARKNGQSYRFQTHTTLELGGPTPTNVTPNQSSLYTAGLGGTALASKQNVKYGSSGAFVLPQDGDVLLKGGSVERSGSLGWIYANYFTPIANGEIFNIEFNGTTTVKITWNIVNSVQVTNASLGLRETSAIRIENFYPVGTLNGTFNIDANVVIGGVQIPFDPTDSFCYITVGESISGVSYDNDGDGSLDAPTTNPTWANLVSNAGTPINGSTPAPTMQFSTANWKEVGVLGGEALRTKTETIGDYRLGINTVAASAHTAYETAFVDVHTDPKANLDVVGTAWITGRTINNYLNEPSGSLIGKTATGERNAFWVGGDRDNPDATATLRVATDLQRVGINVSSSDAILNKTFVVDGDVRFTQTLTIDNGVIDTPSNTFTLAPSTATVDLFPEAVTLSIANAYDDAAQQSINIGNNAPSQILKFGDEATNSLLYIHSKSQNSVIDIGTVASDVAYNSQIFMGGAFANPNSLFNIRNARLKVDGDIQLGTPSTGVTKMYSFTPKLEIFSASGGSNEIDAFRTGSILSIGADAGTTTINNSLHVKASERVDGNITLFGGLSAGELTATRGIFGTTVQQHPLGGLDDLNIDIYKRVEINKTIDAQGAANWGGASFVEDSTTGTYYLPLNQPIGAADLAIGDLILVDRAQVDDQVNSEILRVVDIINPSLITDPEGIRVEVERAQEGTSLKLDHPDNCPLVKLTKQENVSFTTSVVPNGTAGDSVSITTAEFGGSINITDILRLSDTELFDVTAVSSDTNNIQALRINDGAEPTAFTVFEVLSTTGQTTIEGPTEVRNDILLTGTTSNEDRKLTITDGTNVTFEVDAADGDTKLAGDLSVGSDFDEFVVNGDTGTLTMKGGDILVKDDTGANNRLQFVNGNGNLTIAGVIETQGTGTNLFAGDVELNGGDLTVNDGSTLRFGVNNNGTIDLGGIDGYFGATGARRWEYVSTVSGDAGVVASNINLFVKASSNLVLKLPTNAVTGDMIRVVDIGGALTYNVRMIFRAPDGIPIAGDSTNTSNAIAGVNLSGYDGGELIVTTPNAAFGLVYAGATLNGGQPSGIPSNLQGWWLMEI